MRIFFYFLSAVFFINSIALVIRKSFTLGLRIMFCLTAVFFVIGHWWGLWCHLTAAGTGLYIKYIIIFAVFCYILFTGFVLSFSRSTVDYSEDAVIVLGCGLNSDGTPSHTLQNRLDGCIDYYSKNPDCFIVVSGGYSRFNNFTEGSAMKKYLVANGIPENKILTDEQAENTRENFRYAEALLVQAGIPVDNVCYVTNSFHVYRSGIYARNEGFTDIKALSVKTDPVVFIPAVLRETCAVAAQIVFDY